MKNYLKRYHISTRNRKATIDLFAKPKRTTKFIKFISQIESSINELNRIVKTTLINQSTTSLI